MLANQVLPHLYYFCAVAKHKGFSKAAEAFNVSTANISYQIRMLEEKLNISLFKKQSGHRFELTDNGERLAREYHHIFNFINKAIVPMKQQEPTKTINILCPLFFGVNLLVPIIEIIQRKNPGVLYDLQMCNKASLLYEESSFDVDVAIQAFVPEGNFEVEHLLDIKYIAVASEEYLNTMPALEKPEDLVNHKIIKSYRYCPFWNKFKLIYPSTNFPSAENTLVYGNNIRQLHAVAAGKGIAMFPDFFLNDSALKAKGLQVILKDYFESSPISTLYLSYHKLNIYKTEIEELATHLKAHLKDVEPLTIQ